MENFTYDPVSRLTEHKTDAGNQSLNSYGYNTVGNLLTVGNKNQTYDAAGKVTVTGSSDVTYDARNNRTSLVDTVDISKNIEYEWAQNNLLTSATTHEGVGEAPKTVAYAYSADNLLQSRTEETSTDEFVWDTSQAIPAMLSDGKYEYIYSKDRTPIAQIEILTGVVTYLHKDLTGSVTASTDAIGGLVGTVDYSPYGVPTDSLLSRFGYAGEWVDETTGYSYLKARWLDTLTGTFLSEDPLVQMTNNAFGYTDGNPITQIDPLGLFSWNNLGEQMSKVNWSDVSTQVGAVSFALSTAALLAAPVPGLNVILTTAATVTTVVSATISGIAAYQTCTTGEVSIEACSWSVVSAVLSAVPLTRGARSLSNLAGSSKKFTNRLDRVEVDRYNARRANAAFFTPVIDSSGLLVDAGYRLKTAHYTDLCDMKPITVLGGDN